MTRDAETLRILKLALARDPAEMTRVTLDDLRKIDTNREMKRLIAKHELKLRQVADFCMVAYDTVLAWNAGRASTRWRRMPNRALELLKFRLGEQTPPGHRRLKAEP